MKTKVNMNIWIITIIITAVTGITILLMRQTYTAMDYINSLNARKNRVDNPILRESKKNDKDTTDMMIPIVNKSGEISRKPERISVNNVIQLILENTMKANDKIAIMMVYSDDGTIFAHFKPERVGKNMFDVDAELSDCIQDIFKAMKNKKSYNGLTYDPVLNDNIRFIVKPLEIGNFEHNLSLLIGIPESYLLREIRTRTMLTITLTVIAVFAAAAVVLAFLGFLNRQVVTVTDALKEI